MRSSRTPIPRHRRPSTPRNDRASYYGAAGRLRAAEWRQATVTYQGDAEGWPFTVTADDYRYDALGGRALVRTRRTCRLGVALARNRRPKPLSVLTPSDWRSSR